VSGVSGPVKSAKLRVYAFSNTADGPAVYASGNSWSETGVTWNNRPVNISGATDDKGSISTNSWVEYDVTPLVTGNGTHSFNLSSISSDGIDLYSREATSNQPQLAVTFSNTTLPETTIDSGPSGTVPSASASFSFSSNTAGSTFECKLDGAAFASCSSPRQYAGLTEGSHTFSVRATDAEGNVDPTPASRSWVVDTTAPQVSSVAPANGATDVAVANNVEAAFSEAMDASTLSTSTFTLVKENIDGSTTPVVATVSYDSATKKATLDPNGNLEMGATYTATIKGGSAGAKDTAGNTLASDKSWSFTTTTSADLTPPAVQPPAEHFPGNTSTGGTSVPVNLTWSATDGESAIVEYQLQQSSNGGTTFSAVTLSSVTLTSTVIHLTPGKTYQYRVRAKDAAGNVSDWAYGRKFVVSAFQETNSAITYAGTWTQQTATNAYSGALKYAVDAGSTATFTFTGREVAWLAAKAPDRGRAEVWLDGVKVADVDLYRSSAQWRRMVFAAGSLDPSTTHTLTIKVSGTAGRPRVDVDAFFTIR